MLSSICLEAVEIQAAIDHLEDLVEGDGTQERQQGLQQQRRQQSASPPAGAQELKKDCKVKIIGRRFKPWKKGQYVGENATIKDVNPKCVGFLLKVGKIP